MDLDPSDLGLPPEDPVTQLVDALVEGEVDEAAGAAVEGQADIVDTLDRRLMQDVTLYPCHLQDYEPVLCVDAALLELLLQLPLGPEE